MARADDEEPEGGPVPYDGPSFLCCFIESLDLGGQDRVNAEVNFQERKRRTQKVRLGFR